MNRNHTPVVFLTNQLMVLISHQALYTGLVIYAPALALNQSKTQQLLQLNDITLQYI